MTCGMRFFRIELVVPLSSLTVLANSYILVIREEAWLGIPLSVRNA